MNKISLGRVGEWTWSEFFFDKDSHRFIEEQYEEEYLDTGTIFKGASIVTAEHVYRAFADCGNTVGITNLLKYADTLDRSQLSEEPTSK